MLVVLVCCNIFFKDMFLVFLKSLDGVFVVKICLVVVNIDFVCCKIFFKDKFLVFWRIFDFEEVWDFDNSDFVCCNMFFKDKLLVFCRIFVGGEVCDVDNCDLVFFKIFVNEKKFEEEDCFLGGCERIFCSGVFFWGVIIFFGVGFVLYGNECDFGIEKWVIFGLRGEFICFLLILEIVVCFIEELGGFVFSCLFMEVEVIFIFLGLGFCFEFLDVEVIFEDLGFVFCFMVL